jgi:hypothetical protein
MKTTYSRWVPTHFIENVQSLLKLSTEWEGFKVPFFNGRFKPRKLNWDLTRDDIMSE